MSVHPDHLSGHLSSSLSAQLWEAWAVACLRRLEVLASVANHFAFEAQTECLSARLRKIGSMLETIRAAAEASNAA
jgi:hypothetical protein